MKRENYLGSPLLPAIISLAISAFPVRNAEAQPAPKAPVPATPGASPAPGTAAAAAAPGAATLPGASPAPGAAASAGTATAAGAGAGTATARATASAPDPLAEALGSRGGGLTPDAVAKAAAGARPSVRVKRADLEQAAARVDQALISYFPKISVSASYTRLSPVQISLGPAADAAGFEFPLIVNTYSVVGTISVPISDWVLRASQGLSAAAHAEKAKKIELEAEALQVAADARVTYWNWVRTKGQVVVAMGAVAQAKAHLEDAKRIFEVGLLSRADVLRLEAQVASAEQVQVEAEAFAVVVERQLRQAIGAPPDQRLEIGIDVMSETAAAPSESLDALIQQAIDKRLEIRALAETQFALQKNESVTRAGYYPRVEAFADGILANPNQRAFPQEQKWDFTWDVGVRLTWSLTDTLTTFPAVTEAKARTAAVAEQKNLLRQALELEVTQAYSDIKKAASSIEAATRGLAAAEESLRVRSELFKSGKASSVDLIDAETEVTRSRLRRLDAHIGLLVAKTRLDHATGRDVKDFSKDLGKAAKESKDSPEDASAK
jgi:outer membrane protein